MRPSSLWANFKDLYRFNSPFCDQAAYKRRWFGRIQACVISLFYSVFFYFYKDTFDYIAVAIAMFLCMVLTAIAFIPRMFRFIDIIVLSCCTISILEDLLHSFVVRNEIIWWTMVLREYTMLLIVPVGSLVQPRGAIPYVLFLFVAVLLPCLKPALQSPALPLGLTSHLLPHYSLCLLVLFYAFQLDSLARRQFRSGSKLRAQVRTLAAKQRANERLVASIFPDEIRGFVLDSSKADSEARGREFGSAVVVFADLTQFAPYAETTESYTAVSALNKLFALWDTLAQRAGLMKVKTVGDMYMCVGNVPSDCPTGDCEERAVRFALEAIRGFLRMKRELFGGKHSGIMPRFGIHCGKVVAGTIGAIKMTFDIWGDTVNVASRLCTNGSPCHVQISHKVLQAIAKRPLPEHAEAPRVEHCPSGASLSGFQDEAHASGAAKSVGEDFPEWSVESRGTVHLKNRGTVIAYLVGWAERAEDLGPEPEHEPMPLKDDASARLALASLPQSPDTRAAAVWGEDLTEKSDPPAPVLGASELPCSPVSQRVYPITPKSLRTETESAAEGLSLPLGSANSVSPEITYSAVNVPLSSLAKAPRSVNSVSSETSGAFSSATRKSVTTSIEVGAEDGDEILGMIHAALATSTDLQQDSPRSARERATPRGAAAAEAAAAVQTRGLRRFLLFPDTGHYAEYVASTLEDSVRMSCWATIALAVYIAAQCVLDLFLFQHCLGAMLGLHGASLLVLGLLFMLFTCGRRLLLRHPAVIPWLSFANVLVLAVGVYLGMVHGLALHPLPLADASGLLPQNIMLVTIISGYFFMNHILLSFFHSLPTCAIHHVPLKLGIYGVYVVVYFVLSYVLHPAFNVAFSIIYLQAANFVGSLFTMLFSERLRRRYFLDGVENQHAKETLVQEHRASKQLLRSLLPARLVRKIRTNPRAIAEKIPDCTLLYADIVSFTAWCSKLSPQDVVGTLDKLFKRIDMVARQTGVDQCYTIGDCYVATANVMRREPNHAVRMVRFAQRMLLELEAFNQETGRSLRMRVGIGSGAAISAILGTQRFTYDVFGPAASDAKLMEMTGRPGAIHITEAIKQRISDAVEMGPVLSGGATYYLTNPDDPGVLMCY